MEEQRLSFCTATKLADDLVEIVIDEGVEVTADMVDEYHRWLSDHLHSPALVLVNKRNRYSYSFDAQQRVGDGPPVRAIAVITYNPVGTLTARYVAELPRPNPLYTQLFGDRDEALAWLEAQRDPARAAR